MPEFYFDRDDQLERKPYAEFLQNILERNEQYRREDSNGAYVLAVDSPWGTGKSRFAIMLKNYLEKKHSSEGKQNSGSTPKFYAMYYDALSSDYNPDAMEPLMHSLVNSDVLKVNGSADDLKKLKITCVGILKSLSYGVIRFFLGDPAANAVHEAESAISKKNEDPLERYSEKLKLYKEFRTILESAIRRTKRKLVIIIDELDRCKPTFAIQTIEMAKHLFDVPGLVFIFFLDITQLSSAVKCVYGNDMDATGYLCRYFDFISRLPTPDTKKFIDMKLQLISSFSNMGADKEEALNYIYGLSQTFQLSLRDISTILTNYSIMCGTVLQHYKRFQHHRIYLFLLVLKYKNLEIYNTIISDNIVREEQTRFLKSQTYLKRQSVEYQCLLSMLERVPIREVSLTFEFADKKDNTDPVTIVNIQRRGNALEVKCTSKSADSKFEQTILVNENDHWGNVLFFYDLKNWQRIKDISLAEHFLRQLDQFQFARTMMPTSTPVTETTSTTSNGVKPTSTSKSKKKQ